MAPPAQDMLADNPTHPHNNQNNNHNNNSATSAAGEEDLDPATFLRSVRELSEKREREDAERYRKLEEEVEKSRAERAARRAERARSLSPEKMSALVGSRPDTPSALRTAPSLTPSRTNLPASNSDTVRPQPPSPTKDIPEFAGFGSIRKKDNPVASFASSPAPRTSTPPSASSLSRQGTLSWQQRPDPTSTKATKRPLSMFAPASQPVSSRIESSGMSRKDIAASLALRDPAWFKQTAERGMGNAALNKNRDDDTPDHALSRDRRILPGLARDMSPSLSRSVSPAASESQRAETPRPMSVRDSTYSSRFSADTTASYGLKKPDLGALIAADAEQDRASPMSNRTASREATEDLSNIRTPTMSSSQARLTHASERPSSPTKGVGGFVQSAMMKRSDSVSKRWSAQPTATAIHRQNSTQNATSGLQASQSMPKLDPAQRTQDPSSELGSAAEHAKEIMNMSRRPIGQHHHARNKSFSSLHSLHAEDSIASPPASPSKRWSPTKASWIESALNKPESVRPPTPKNAQPSWMVDIAKAKAQRAGTDVPTIDIASQSGEESSWMLKPSAKLPAPASQNGADSAELQPLAHLRSQVVTPPAKPRSIGLGLHTVASPTSKTHDLPQSSDGSFEQLTIQRDPKPANHDEDLHESDPDAEQANDAHTSPSVPQAMKSASIPTLPKAKPDAPPKPITDFRSNLRARPPTEAKKEETPEFLSKFGNLRRAQTEKYVAPDLLKDNITRGKADLVKTGGPVKTPRRDELKEILLAKKDDIKKAKEEGKPLPGEAHQLKTAKTPVIASKPEALVKKDLLSRVATTKSEPNLPLRPRDPTPEALSRRKILSDQSSADTDNARAGATSTATKDASKPAASFNSGLANLLARGPPSSAAPRAQKFDSPAPITAGSASHGNGTADAVAPLQDMRKGRAKGPKKRNQSARAASNAVAPAAIDSLREGPTLSGAVSKSVSSSPFAMRASPQTMPGARSAALNASILADTADVQKKDSGLASISTPGSQSDVAEFTSFRSPQASRGLIGVDDNKENAASIPVAKSAASRWNQPKAATTTPIKSMSLPIPSKKDEDAAMRSAGLLASSPIRSVPGTPTDLRTSAILPPKPAKSSRIVSGQLQEANPNKGTSGPAPKPATAAEHRLADLAGSWPVNAHPLTINVDAVIAATKLHTTDDAATFKRTTYELSSEAGLLAVPQAEECMLFEHSVYLCHHISSTKKSKIYLWIGNLSSQYDDVMIEDGVRALIREKGASAVHRVAQGHEDAAFLKIMGGILITRRGARRGASKQYVLQGRKHLESFVFDEVDWDVASLCPGFVYLISHPITLQKVNMYLWKGFACSMEETSAARLAAMELSESGEITEFDDGKESASFLKSFGSGVKKSPSPTRRAFWQHKARDPVNFAAHLFRVQQTEVKDGFIASLWRKSSWSNLSTVRSMAGSPSRPAEDVVKVEVRHICPFTQQELDAESVYVLDAHSEVYVFVGPLFKSLANPRVRASILMQALRFSLEYSHLVKSRRDLKSLHPYVVLDGIPPECAFLFRHWDAEHALWGTSSLMAGSLSGNHARFQSMPVRQLLAAAV